MINKRSKRLIVGILSVMLAIMTLYFNPTAQAAETNAPPVYTDLSPTSPDISYVTYLSSKGIITGYPDGSFKPTESLTRAQAAVVIVKAANLGLDQTAASPFKDLRDDHWARPYINAAVKAGYIKGFPDGTFQPDQPLSRAQGIVLLLRLSKQPQTAILPILKDINNQHWAASAVAVGLASGMVGVSADGQNYLPDVPFSRINMAHALGILLTHDPDMSVSSLPGKLKPVQGLVAVIKAGSLAEYEISAETVVNQGDTIITKQGASAELTYPDGSSMLIKENSKIRIKEAKGRKYVQTNGQEGIAVDWLNLDMKQGSMFAALATKHEGTASDENAESSSTDQTSQIMGLKHLTLASLNAPQLIAAAANNNQNMPWYQSGKSKKVKVKVDMPWGIAAVRGTFVLISITPDGHANVSCLTGDAEVSNAGQTVTLGQNQSTTINTAAATPGTVTPLTSTEVQQFNQVQNWVVNTSIQMDVNREAVQIPVVEMIVEIPDQPAPGTTQAEQAKTTLDVVLNALQSSGITITEQVKQELTQQLQNLPQEKTETVKQIIETTTTTQSNSNQSSGSSSSSGSNVLFLNYSSPGTYGPNTAAETQTIAKNIIVSSMDVTLQNMIITGDLTLAAGIGAGSVTLNNVTVQGNTIILGGGSNSIHVINCGLYTVTVDNQNNTVRIVAEGSSSVGNLTLNSGAILEENGLSGVGFSTVNTGTSLPAGATIILTGNFTAVNINSPGLIIQVEGGNIDQMNIASNATGALLNLAAGANVNNLQISAAAHVTGTGKIKNAAINANSVVLEQKPDAWTIGSGVGSANIAGKIINESGQASINAMTGTAVIIGTVKYGQTLTADITNLINAGTPTYQWNRNGEAIGQAIGASYTLAEADIGTAITVTVTADGVAGTGSITSMATEVIAKADGPAAPAAPVLATKTDTSVTLVANSLNQFSKNAGTTWQDSEVFTGLSASTDYTFIARVKATPTTNGSAASAGTVIKTDPTAMTGTAVIKGTAKYGQTLTADITNLTNAGTPTYQWNRNGAAIDQATGASYTLAEADIGTVITITVTADGVAGKGSITSTATEAIAKADGPAAPAAPVAASKTDTSVTLVANALNQFSKDAGATWQDSEVFTGLSASTDYTFIARVKATPTSHESAASTGTLIKTDPAAMTGTVTITGIRKYGQTLTADITNLTNAGTPTYQWNHNGAAIGQASGASYTLAETDIGTAITVTVTADGVAGKGSITSAATEAIAKADGPAALTDSITGIFPVAADSINLTGIATASLIEIEAAVAIDGSTYGDYVDLAVNETGNATLSGLNGVTTATKVKIRIKATITTFAGLDREISVTIGQDTAYYRKISGTVSLPVVSNQDVQIDVYANADYTIYGNTAGYYGVKKTITIQANSLSAPYEIRVPPNTTGSGYIVGYYYGGEADYIQYGRYMSDGTTPFWTGCNLLDLSSADKTDIDLIVLTGRTISGTVSLPTVLSQEVQIDVYADDAGNGPVGIEADGHYSKKTITIPANTLSVTYKLILPTNEVTSSFIVGYNYGGEADFIGSGYYNSISTKLYRDDAEIIDLSSSNRSDVDLTLLTGRKISGTVSLPEEFGQDVQIDVFADTCNAVTESSSRYFSARKSITIPANTLSVAYKLIVPANAADSGYKVGYCYNGEADYLRNGYYSSDSTVLSLTDAELVDLSSTDQSGINLALLSGRKISGTLILTEALNEYLEVYVYASGDYYTGKTITIPANTLSVGYKLIVPVDTVGSGYKVGYRGCGEFNYSLNGYYNSNATTSSFESAELVNPSSEDKSGIDLTLSVRTISGTVTLPEVINQEVKINIFAMMNMVTLARSSYYFYTDKEITIPANTLSVAYKLIVPANAVGSGYEVGYEYEGEAEYYGCGYYMSNATTPSRDKAELVDLSGASVSGINLTVFTGRRINGIVSLPETINQDVEVDIHATPDNDEYDFFNSTTVTIPANSHSVAYELIVLPNLTASGYWISYELNWSFANENGYLSSGYHGVEGSTENYDDAVLIDVSEGNQDGINLSILKTLPIISSINALNSKVTLTFSKTISEAHIDETGNWVPVVTFNDGSSYKISILDENGDYSMCLHSVRYTAGTNILEIITPGAQPGTQYNMTVYKGPEFTQVETTGSFTFPVDTLPPEYITGYPKVQNVSSNTADLAIQTHEFGKTYYVALLTDELSQYPGYEPATADAVMNWNPDSYDQLSSWSGSFGLYGDPASITINQLRSNAGYKVYVVAKDEFGNLTPSISVIDFQTLQATQGTTATVWTTGNPPLHEMEELLFFEVVDADGNIDSNNIDTVKVRIYSDTDNDGFDQTITESAVNSGEFTGTVKIGTSTNTTSSPTSIKAAVGDDVVIEYTDALDGNGNVNQITDTYITVIAEAPSMTKLTATVDGTDIESTDGTLTVVQGSVTSVIKVTMSEPVNLVGTPIVTVNIDGVDYNYGMITVDPTDTTNKTLIITPNGSNGTAGLVGTFTFTVAQDSVEDAAKNGNTLTDFSLTVIDNPDLDISASFTDINFKQAVWEWLGNAVGSTPGTFTKQDLTDRMATQSYTLDVSRDNIISMEGLEKFEGTGILYLYCYKNQLTSMPTLPSSLEYLDCDSNLVLSSLPDLPSNLVYLNCAQNQLTSLPTLPDSLTDLRCSGNLLTSLPGLPSRLTQLSCDNNQLTSLPDLPSSLTELSCANTQLSNLPDLPDGLICLRCSGNQLSALPDLPNSLIELDCNDNQLNSLPDLPIGMIYLICDNNMLTSLPALPISLTRLVCEQNLLSDLPVLPGSLTGLQCFCNFLNVFSDGPAKTALDNCTASYKVITPQNRYSYVGTNIELIAGANSQLTGDGIMLQESSNGTTWSDIKTGAISEFTFSSSDETVATVKNNGLITAIDEGTCAVYARYKNIDSAYTVVAITVTVGVETAPTMLSLIATIDGTDETSADETLSCTVGQSVSSIKVTMSEKVVLASTPVVTISGGTIPTGTQYGTITIDSDDTTGKTLIITPDSGNETAGQVGTFTFTVAAGVLTDELLNPNIETTFTLEVKPVSVSLNIEGLTAYDGSTTTALDGTGTDVDPYILNLDPAKSIYILQFAAGSSSNVDLGTGIGLKLINSTLTTEQISQLEAYYGTMVDPYKTYCLGALALAYNRFVGHTVVR